jgi:hypothetical protein
MSRYDLLAPAAQGGTGDSDEISEESRRLYRELVDGDGTKLAQFHELALASERLEKPEELPPATPARSRWRVLSAHRAA